MGKKVNAAEAVLAAARELAAREGWADVSLQEIRLAAGMSNGSLWHAFRGGKAELGRALHARLEDSLWKEPMQTLMAPNASAPVDIVRDALRALAKAMAENRDDAGLYFELDAAVAPARSEPSSGGLAARRSALARLLGSSVGSSSAPDEDAIWVATFGPLIEYCRLWASRQVDRSPQEAVQGIVDAAQSASWTGKKAMPGKATRRPLKGESAQLSLSEYVPNP